MKPARFLILQSAAALLATLAFGPLDASAPQGVAYAVRGATVHTAAGAPLSNATVVIRDGVIAAVGTDVTPPADAIVIDGAGMHVYPGLIDMANAAPLGAAAPAAAAGGRGGGGRGAGGGGQEFANREEAERAKRAALLRPDFLAADNLTTEGDALTALVSAGVTTVLAVPATGIFKGQSALVNVALPPEDPQISNVGEYRKGLAVITSPVAMHIDMAGRGGGPGYPQALLGTIAFAKQGLLDAEWQREARAYYAGGGTGPRPVYEPALDALVPVLDRKMPAAFDASEAREIDRALAMAREFNLDPIIVGAAEAADRTAELAAAKARVILSLDFPGAQAGGGGRGGRGGGGASPSLSALQAQVNAPKTAAALLAAGVPFTFTSAGASPADFVRNAARTVREGGLTGEAALAALTIDAARMAGAASRTGSLEVGKAANVIVVGGDLFDGGQLRHVFVDGHPIEITPPAPGQAGGGRRGGGPGR